MHVDPWVWVAFVAFILAMLAVDLFWVHREPHRVEVREAALWSVVWIGCALAFGALVWIWLGPQPGQQYLAGYLIEKSLSVDNVFVFSVIFSMLAIPPRYHHGVLFWGVLGALVFRAVCIAGGVTLLERFHDAIYVFGAFLVFTGIRMAFSTSPHVDANRNPVLRLMRRIVPVTEDLHGHRMVVRRAGRLMATPLLAVLIVVETSDVIFAVDSIPAVLAVTRDPFLVFTSNAFAILGLRALYFLLAGMIERFRHLKVGLAVVLVFVGTKMLLSTWVEPPIWLTLSVIAVTIGLSVAASLRGPWADVGIVSTEECRER